MKRIGIVTWFFGANYGALAQSIALYETIRSFGCECLMVDYRPKGYWKIILNVNLPSGWKRMKHIYQTINGVRKIMALSDFKHFKLSDKVSCPKDLDNLNLDCIVFGSDAIFNVRHPLFNPIYYGVGVHTKKVTYSPSCEYVDKNSELSAELKKALQEMYAISVRDKNTFNIVYNNTGIRSLITVDPTFLYRFEKYESKLDIKNYILIYSFSEWSEYNKDFKDYAAKNNLSIVAVGVKSSWADYSYPHASLEKWISLFKNAHLVITDSFHGTVFSLKNMKQIVLCGREDKKAKISSLLNQFGAKLNIYLGGDVDSYLQQNVIDYDTVNLEIENDVRKSIKYLMSALEV